MLTQDLLDGNAGLARPTAQTGEGNQPNEFCQLVEIPQPLLTPLCKQVPTQIKAQEPLGAWDRYSGQSPHTQHSSYSEQRAAMGVTTCRRCSRSQSSHLPWDRHTGFFPRWIHKQLVGKHVPSRPLVSLHLDSCHAALPVEQLEITSSPVSHRQHLHAEGTWRELSASRSTAGSARARLAASVPPLPSPSPGASVPTAPWDGHGCFELLCQITLPRANHSV